MDQVAALKKEFEGAQLVVAAQYRGLKMAQLNELRAALKPSKSRFRVVKNTLAGIAADQAGRPAVREIMGGPVGIITSPGDPSMAARALMAHLQASRIELKITGGVVGTQVLTPARLDELGKLPPREQLLSRIMGQMNAPVTGLVTVLNGPLRALAIALQRVAEQKGTEQPASPAAPGA
jgi:large subunit ribosomal protein L10